MRILKIKEGWEQKLMDYVRNNHSLKDRNPIVIKQVCELIISYIKRELEGEG